MVDLNKVALESLQRISSGSDNSGKFLDFRLPTPEDSMRASLDEFTKLLSQNGAPFSIDDNVLREIRMNEPVEHIPHSSPPDFLGYGSTSSDQNTPVGPESEDVNMSQNLEGYNFLGANGIPPSDTRDLGLLNLRPIEPFHHSVSDTATVAIKEEVKRKKRKLSADDLSLPFHFYDHPKHALARLFNNERNDITSSIDFDVRADRNLSFSESDDSWILYKQNQFQITAECRLLGRSATFQVETQRGVIHPVERFFVRLYAIQCTKKEITEDDEVLIQVFQTGKIRSKEHNLPAEPCVLKSGVATLSKLRFQSSTANNARTKTNETNPNQNYFRLVVGLFAQIASLGAKPAAIGAEVPGQDQQYYEVATRISERLIVRGQNPGRYTSKPSKNQNQQPQPQTNTLPPISAAQILPSIPSVINPPMHHLNTGFNPARDGWVKRDDDALYHSGKVGINTMSPQEALSVHGNIMLTGNVVKPSDRRIKENFQPVATADQLERIENLRIFDYDLKDWTEPSAKNKRERGVIAQDLEKVMPYAVHKLGDVPFKDGHVVQNLLVVNERVLLFENIGATQELGKLLRQELEKGAETDERVSTNYDAFLQSDVENRGRVDRVIDFITNDEFENGDPESCFNVSIFGLGPAWSLWVIGWILPPVWLPGILFIASISSSQRRWAGAANLLSVLLFTFLVYLVVYFSNSSLKEFRYWIFFSAYCAVGVILIFALTLYTNKRNRKRRVAKKNLRTFMSSPKEIPLPPKIYSYESSSNLEDVARMATSAYRESVGDDFQLQSREEKPKKKVSFNTADHSSKFHNYGTIHEEDNSDEADEKSSLLYQNSDRNV